MIVYIAGPMTPKDGFTAKQNLDQAVEAWIELVQACIPSFCPQLGNAIETHVHGDYDLWMRYDFALIDCSTHVLMLPRWESSYGASLEHEHALKTGKQVCYAVSEVLSARLAMLQPAGAPGEKRENP